jgi:hypothetical protein
MVLNLTFTLASFELLLFSLIAIMRDLFYCYIMTHACFLNSQKIKNMIKKCFYKLTTFTQGLCIECWTITSDNISSLFSYTFWAVTEKKVKFIFGTVEVMILLYYLYKVKDLRKFWKASKKYCFTREWGREKNNRK